MSDIAAMCSTFCPYPSRTLSSFTDRRAVYTNVGGAKYRLALEWSSIIVAGLLTIPIFCVFLQWPVIQEEK